MSGFRIAAGLAITALVAGLTVMVGAVPAQAATVIDTRVEIKLGATKAVAGKPVRITVKVEGFHPEGEWIPVAAVGKISLQRRLNGQKKWVTIRKATPGKKRNRFTVKAQGNARYRASYSGGTYIAPPYNWRFKKVVGKPTKLLRTARKVKMLSAENLVVKGRVTPQYGRKPVVVERKLCDVGCTWKRWQTVRTDKRGVFTFRAEAPGAPDVNWFYRTYAPKDKRFIKSRGDRVSRTYSHYN